MNWFKTAQQYPPIAIVSYTKDYGELGISFNGGKKYVYENINPMDYNRIDTLLRHRNYSAAQKLLQSWSQKKKETEEDRQGMLDELYERGILQ